MPLDYNALYQEIIKPAYTGKTDAEIATLLNTASVNRNRKQLPNKDIIEAFDPAEFAALSQAQLLRLSILLAPDIVNIRSAVVRQTLNDIFPANSVTRTNLVALRTETISPADNLDLGVVTVNDITEARRLYANN